MLKLKLNLNSNPNAMKNVKSENPDSTVLAKYLSDEMSLSEQSLFVNSTDSVTKGELDDLKLKWENMKKMNLPANPDESEAWNKLHEKLKQDNLLPEQKHVSKRILNRKVLRYAAIFALLMGIGSVVYYNYQKVPSSYMLSLKTENSSGSTIRTLTDGSVIFLASNTLFSYPEKFASNKREVQLTGEAFFDIKSDEAKPFIIETDEAIIQVLGTAFNVKNYSINDFELIVNRGKVKVTLKGNPSQSLLVIAGESVKINNLSLVKSKSKGNVNWYKQKMQFKDETLQNIIQVLNTNYNTSFSVDNAEIGNQRMTIAFDQEPASTMAELICLTLNLKVNEKNGSIEFVENKTKPE